ncbi:MULTISPECIES: regulator of eIF2 [Brenneria]|uniref:Regulator n=1 Tax=Brenneria nigrifluens DSM 30175 = ATCC 13028 TaxID=1121120 RepID=A0A2U1U8U1_9GAMM|nr:MULTISPECIES: regulator of eIF2 [Brenneria]EHD21388.1 D123 family protein, regulator of eIF2 [Brenneria sp. EniD312]PWC18073.1 regulator [Brenneria nigrifluens] [Brenneria nigrifluens DSM 30175 = ATCC 13028]QCR04518.1 regulator [Brenneria nigrifluens] [Brenneria nigrifluens DSM 30175 = ATCC 13028]
MYSEYKKTFIENWSEDILAQSFKSESIELHERDVIAIGASTDEFMSARGLQEKPFFSAQLHDDIEYALSVLNKPAFVRFGGVSYHDASLSRLDTVDGIVKQLSVSNRCVASYLWDCLQSSTPVWLFLREWRDIPRWGEFRCFIRDAKVIGVSQYHCLEYFPFLKEKENEIRLQLIMFLQKLLPVLHMNSVVADIAIDYQDGKFTTTLIELNPFIQRTDACLFSWVNGGDFNGRIRVNHSIADAHAEKRKRPYLL